MALWLVVILIVNKFTAMSPLTLTLTFFGLLAVPGFALARLLKIKPADLLSQWMFWLTLGLIFGFLVSAAVMIAGGSIFVLIWLYLLLIMAVFAGAFIVDLLRPAHEENFSWDFNRLLDWNNLGLVLVILVAGVVVIGVGIQGSLFRGGDANFHLSIFRKAFEGSSLSPAALSFIKSNTIHVAYGLPIWHIFLGFLTRLAQSDVFLVWKTISIPLSIFAVLVWYWLAKIIFQNRFLAVASLAIFLNYIFNWNTGYLFTVLPFPDTLNNYLLFPLAVAILLYYVFDTATSLSAGKTGNLKILGILVIFAPLMANIHMTQYFYLVIIMVLLALLWLIFFWGTKDFKKILTRMGLALAAGLIFFLPLLAFIEIKSRVITKTVVALWNAASSTSLRYTGFEKLNYFGKWAFMLIAPAFLFIRKHRTVLFLPVMFVFLVLTFVPEINHFLVRILGTIFVNRIFGSVFWHFLILALVYGFIVLIIDRSLNLLPKLWRWVTNGVLALGLGILIWAEVKFQTAGRAYEWLFSNPVDDWFNQYYLWMMAVLAIATLGILIWQWRKPKIQSFFEFGEPKNGLMASVLIFALVVILFGTTYPYGRDYVKMTLERPFIFQPVSFLDFRTGESHRDNVVKSIGGPEGLAFFQNEIPPKSVFLVPGGVVNTFPTLLDQFMVDYPKKKDLLKAQEVYKEKNSIGIEEAKTIFKKEKIQYILFTDAPDQNQAFFDAYAEVFEKIFDKDGVAIYKFTI